MFEKNIVRKITQNYNGFKTLLLTTSIWWKKFIRLLRVRAWKQAISEWILREGVNAGSGAHSY